jgi:zinc transport system ATP-binding protein
MEPVVKLENIYSGYNNQPAIKSVDLSIFEHDFIGMIGPNGGGKTTLLKTILGLLKPMSGRVVFYENGKEVPFIQLGYLPQINAIDKKFPISVEEVINSGLVSKSSPYFITGPKRKTIVHELMERLGIALFARKPIGELSGGQMQRAFLARALISHPRLLILDEPSTYVDSNFEKELYQILDELNREMAILLVSHDVGMVAAHVKTIACVNSSVQVHDSNLITTQMMAVYNCPIEIISHGDIPHRVLDHHHHNNQ